MSVRVGLAAVVIVAAVAGCGGGDPAPTEMPTAASTAATTPPSTLPSTPPPTPAATPTPPPQPAASRADTPAGAESFARYWLTTLDYGYKTGDTDPFLAAGRCKSCDSLAKGIGDYYSAGGRFEGGTFTATDVQTTRHVKTSAALVDLVYSRAAGEAIASGDIRKPIAAEDGVEFLLTLERSNTNWQVSAVKTVSR